MDSFDWVKLKEEIERDEGRRNKPYECTEGFLTIGVGWNLDVNGLPEHIIDELLDISLLQASKDCEALYKNWYKIDSVRQRVLVNMAFNLGRLGLSKFKKMNAAIHREDWDAAAEEMLDSRWATQVGARAKRLHVMMRTGK